MIGIITGGLGRSAWFYSMGRRGKDLPKTNTQDVITLILFVNCKIERTTFKEIYSSFEMKCEVHFALIKF